MFPPLWKCFSCKANASSVVIFPRGSEIGWFCRTSLFESTRVPIDACPGPVWMNLLFLNHNECINSNIQKKLQCQILVAAHSFINWWTRWVWASRVHWATEGRYGQRPPNAVGPVDPVDPVDPVVSPTAPSGPPSLGGINARRRGDVSSCPVFSRRGVMLVELIACLPNVSLHIILFYLLIACA